MESVDIFPLTRVAISRLLGHREALGMPVEPNCQRRARRWPFPGAVELWLNDEGGRERYALATAVNLSEDGIGVKFEESIKPGSQIGIAFHEPEASFHGRAIVRHCTEIRERLFYLGMQFVFDES